MVPRSMFELYYKCLADSYVAHATGKLMIDVCYLMKNVEFPLLNVEL